jgi:hypothetical protein
MHSKPHHRKFSPTKQYPQPVTIPNRFSHPPVLQITLLWQKGNSLINKNIFAVMCKDTIKRANKQCLSVATAEERLF